MAKRKTRLASQRWENFKPEQKFDIEQMTNWQRNQWIRAGYPENTAYFTAMEKPTHA